MMSSEVQKTFSFQASFAPQAIDGAWGQSVPCRGAAKTARGKQIMAGMPAQLPQKCRAQEAPLIWAKVGVLRRVRENVVKSGHVVGLGSFGAKPI
jgi:hypothetical protein